MQLPNNWTAREYQHGLWRALAHERKKRAVAVWHRRSGKDEIALHWTATAAFERVGNYWHMLPQANQARKAIWDAVNPHTGKRRIDEASRYVPLEQLALSLIEFHRAVDTHATSGTRTPSDVSTADRKSVV